MSEIDGGFDPSSINDNEEVLGDSTSQEESNLLLPEQVSNVVGPTTPEDPEDDEVKQQSLQEQMIVPQSEPGPLPMVDPQTGTYTDETGNWASQKGIPSKDLQYVSKRVGQVRTMKGVIQKGKTTTLYNLADIEKIISERDQLPQPDPETGIYTNEGEWAGRTYFGDAAYQTLMKKRGNIRSIPGRTVDGHNSILFSIEDARKVLAPFESLPRVDKESGIYKNESGEWVSIGYFGNKRVRDYLISKGDLVRSMNGRGLTGQAAILFNLEDAQKVLEQIQGLPRAEKGGLYTNEAGDWGTQSYFSDSDIQYLRNSGDIRKMQGIGANGVESVFYNLEDAQKVLAERDALPRVGEGGVYKDDLGDWGSQAAIGDTDLRYVLSRGVDVRTINGRAANGNDSALYNLEDVRRILAERDALPRVGEGGVYKDGLGEWGSNDFFGEDAKYLRYQKDKIRIIQGRNLTGGPAALYNVEDVRRVLQERDLLPQIDQETGIYENDDGKWGGYKALGGADYQRLQKLKGQVRTIQGRSGGAPATLFNLEEARNILDKIHAMPQVNEEGQYTDIAGEGWGISKFFGGADSQYLAKHADEIRTQAGRSHRGIDGLLYNISDARRVLAERDKNKAETKTNVSPDDADELMRSLEVE